MPRHERARLAAAILLAMVAVATAGWLSLLEAALLAGGLMLLTQCTTAASARPVSTGRCWWLSVHRWPGGRHAG